VNAVLRLEPEAAPAGVVPAPDARGLDSIEVAVQAMAAGRPVLVVDNEDRENEGDIIFAAQHATPALMGWTIRYSSGVICVPLSGDRADALALPPMVAVNEDAKGTAYTVSCDAALGVSTGISATDRALTARVLADPHAVPASLTRPGHIFPLRAVDGGVRERPGHTEAAVDLATLADLEADPAVFDRAIEREAELALRLVPCGVEGVACVAQVGEHALKILPHEMGQHEPIVECRAPAHERAFLRLPPEPRDEGA